MQCSINAHDTHRGRGGGGKCIPYKLPVNGRPRMKKSRDTSNLWLNGYFAVVIVDSASCSTPVGPSVITAFTISFSPQLVCIHGATLHLKQSIIIGRIIPTPPPPLNGAAVVASSSSSGTASLSTRSNVKSVAPSFVSSTSSVATGCGASSGSTSSYGRGPYLSGMPNPFNQFNQRRHIGIKTAQRCQHLKMRQVASASVCVLCRRPGCDSLIVEIASRWFT